MSDLKKIDAVIAAFQSAKNNGRGYAYVIQTIDGWIVGHDKPMLRYGQVIECCANGEQYIA